MRVLISRLSSMGDVVCTLPAACALKDAGVATEIVWVCDRRFADLPRHCDAVDEVVEWTKAEARDRRRWHELGLFDVALDLQGLLKSALVVGAANAKRRYGYHWQREGARFFSAPVKPDPTSFHIVDQIVDVARFLGAEVDRARFGLQPSPEATDSVLAKVGHRSRPWVVVNPGAGWPSKRWRPESVAQLCDQVVEKSGTPTLIGGPDVLPVRDTVAANLRHPCVDLVGQTTIPELVALIALADAHVGGDTGSTHIAAALGKPAVGIYTVSDPRRVCPYGQIDNVLTGQPDPAAVFAILTGLLSQVPAG